MSDAKELVERLRKFAYARKAYDIQFTIETEAADWIERWAPVVEAARVEHTARAAVKAADQGLRLRGGDETERGYHVALRRLDEAHDARIHAIAAALGGDKP